MEKLDNLIAEHIADRLLQPERLEEVLASVLDRRQERAGRRREHVAELNKRVAETDLRLKRLYDAIEAGVANLDDPALKDRIASLKTIRDQAQADAQRAAVMLESSAHKAITPQMVQKFAGTAWKRIRIEGGGYRRDFSGRWPSASRSRTKRSASWDRRAICSERWTPSRAQSRLRLEFAVLF
jgi:site-specific DNA recombinase